MGVASDITGVASIVNDGANAYDDFFVTGNWKTGIWDTVKSIGTGAFLIFGGKEATLGVKGAELLWNVGTMVRDDNVGKP